MTDEERSRELTRSSFAAQMAMLGYEPNGNPKDMVEVVRCKDCKYHFVNSDNVRFNMCLLNHNKVQSDDWFCADGERR